MENCRTLGESDTSRFRVKFLELEMLTHHERWKELGTKIGKKCTSAACACICVCESERECVCVHLCVYESERECVCMCACVRVYNGDRIMKQVHH